jgi:bifunctional non-homologous end joining protein LigD
MSKREDAIEIEGVRLTSPSRVLYDEQGITKLELAEYYREVAAWMLPHLADRPLTLIRCPQGQEKYCFVQRRVSESFPRYIHRVTVEVEGEEEGEAVHIAVSSLPGILYLVQIGVLEIHTWGSKRDRLDRPDRLVLDLDPDASVPFPAVIETALQIRARLAGLGLESFVKTTGGKGLHVVVPLSRGASWDEVHDVSRALAEEMVGAEPTRYLAEASKAGRAGKIFIDYMRNAYSATAVAPFSTRARPDAPVSTPLSWGELEAGITPADFTVLTVPERLRKLKRDPWEAYGKTRQGLTKAVRAALGVG